MAFEGFKETIWAKGIERALMKRCVLEGNCNRQYQGEIGEGKRVKIMGATRPTISTYIPGNNINAAESPADTSVFLDVNQYKYANYFVDSIYAAQTDSDILGALAQGAADSIAEIRDSYIGSLALGSTNMSEPTAIASVDDAAKAIDAGLVKLWDNGVRTSDDIRIELPPWLYDLFTNKIIALNTNNSSIIANGEVGTYKGAHVVMSNCLYNDAGDDFIMIRTKKAIAFAGGIHRVVPYEPELQFGEAVKILDTYGAKICRPDELYALRAHQA